MSLIYHINPNAENNKIKFTLEPITAVLKYLNISLLIGPSYSVFSSLLFSPLYQYPTLAEAAHVSITAFATKPIFRAPAAAPMRPAASAPSIPSSVAYQPSLWQPVTPSSEPTVAMPTDRLPWEKPYEPQQPSKPAQSPVFRFLVSLSCAVE